MTITTNSFELRRVAKAVDFKIDEWLDGCPENLISKTNPDWTYTHLLCFHIWALITDSEPLRDLREFPAFVEDWYSKTIVWELPEFERMWQ